MLSNRPVRTRTPGGVAGVPSLMEAAYADVLHGLAEKPASVDLMVDGCSGAVAAKKAVGHTRGRNAGQACS